MLRKICIFALLGVISLSSHAASIDGAISTGEYQWNTTAAEGSDKWVNFSRNGRAYKEYDDASGGNDWDINYLGTDIKNGQFQFGALGGKILSGVETGKKIFLSDFAIGVNTSSNPTTDSSGFQYAIRLLGVNDLTGIAKFALLGKGIWENVDLYNGQYGAKHKSETYKMRGATTITTFDGIWKQNGSDKNVLEGGFDLSWLSLFDPSIGGTLSTYLTMACVNDEALVHAAVSAVPLPAAIWLFTPVLLGLMSMRRNKKA